MSGYKSYKLKSKFYKTFDFYYVSYQSVGLVNSHFIRELHISGAENLTERTKSTLSAEISNNVYFLFIQSVYTL